MRSGVEVYKRTHESTKKRVRFGEQALVILRVRPQQYGKFEDHALTDELGYREREMSVHWPAVNADMR